MMELRSSPHDIHQDPKRRLASKVGLVQGQYLTLVCATSSRKPPVACALAHTIQKYYPWTSIGKVKMYEACGESGHFTRSTDSAKAPAAEMEHQVLGVSLLVVTDKQVNVHTSMASSSEDLQSLGDSGYHAFDRVLRVSLSGIITSANYYCSNEHRLA